MRNRQELLSAAAEMTNIARTDISNKLRELMRDTDATEREMAYVLDISDAEMYELLHENGDVSLSTFMKIMIATGYTIEVKSLNDVMPPVDPFRNPIPTGPLAPPPPLHINEEEFREPDEDDDEDDFDDEENEPSHENEEMPEPPFFHPFPYGRPEGCRPDDGLRPFRPAPRPFNPYRRPEPVAAPERPQPERPATSGKCNFRSKTKDELVRIIVNKLWDSEIDIARATFDELVSFLESKERRRQQLQSGEEPRPSAMIMDFINKLKDATKENPSLMKYIKKYLKED